LRHVPPADYAYRCIEVPPVADAEGRSKILRHVRQMEDYIHRRPVREVIVVDKVAVGKFFFSLEYFIFHLFVSFHSCSVLIHLPQTPYIRLTHLSRPIVWATATRPFRFLNLCCRHLVRPPWETNWPFAKPLPTGQLQTNLSPKWQCHRADRSSHPLSSSIETERSLVHIPLGARICVRVFSTLSCCRSVCTYADDPDRDSGHVKQ
jgi:hypothetical protein